MYVKCFMFVRERREKNGAAKNVNILYINPFEMHIEIDKNDCCICIIIYIYNNLR